MQTHLFTPEEEVTEAQAAVAERLERLARMVRRYHGRRDVEVWDELYKAIDPLSKSIREVCIQ